MCHVGRRPEQLVQNLCSSSTSAWRCNPAQETRKERQTEWGRKSVSQRLENKALRPYRKAMEIFVLPVIMWKWKMIKWKFCALLIPRSPINYSNHFTFCKYQPLMMGFYHCYRFSRSKKVYSGNTEQLVETESRSKACRHGEASLWRVNDVASASISYSCFSSPLACEHRAFLGAACYS